MRSRGKWTNIRNGCDKWESSSLNYSRKYNVLVEYVLLQIRQSSSWQKAFDWNYFLKTEIFNQENVSFLSDQT